MITTIKNKINPTHTWRPTITLLSSSTRWFMWIIEGNMFCYTYLSYGYFFSLQWTVTIFQIYLHVVINAVIISLIFLTCLCVWFTFMRMTSMEMLFFTEGFGLLLWCHCFGLLSGKGFANLHYFTFWQIIWNCTSRQHRWGAFSIRNTSPVHHFPIV